MDNTVNQHGMTQSQVDQAYKAEFTKPIIRWGRLTNLLAFFFCFTPALTVAFVFDAMPPIRDILTGWGLIAAIFGIYCIVEPVSYFPVLGIPGTYMSFLAGNISNMRLPVSAIAQEVLGTEQGSKKAELVSTLSIAGSIITNLIVTTIAAVGGAALMSVFPPVVIEAFGYVGAAIFGAMFAMYTAKNLKLGAFALVIVMIMFLVVKVLPPWAMILIAVFGTVAFGFALLPKDK